MSRSRYEGRVPVTPRLPRSASESRDIRTKRSKMANARQTLHKLPVSSRFECIALLLQGGGALGAYQAGVYQALSEARLQPDWVAGISIGAINAALIADNTPETRVAKLRAFWERITPVQPLDSIAKLGPVSWMRGEISRGLLNHLSAGASTLSVKGTEFEIPILAGCCSSSLGRELLRSLPRGFVQLGPLITITHLDSVARWVQKGSDYGEVGLLRVTSWQHRHIFRIRFP